MFIKLKRFRKVTPPIKGIIRLNRADTETNFLVFHHEPSVAGNLILFPSTLKHIQEENTDTEETDESTSDFSEE